MAIDFPNSPTVGQIFTSGDKSWIWDGTVWKAYGASLSPTVLKVDSTNTRVGINNQSPAYTLDVNGTVEATQFIQGADYLTPYTGFRNAIINGSFNVWQRSLDATVNGSDAYASTDRWRQRTEQVGGSLRVSRQTSGRTGGPQYCARVQRPSGNSNTGALQIIQTLDTTSSLPLAGGPITLSFYARSGANYSPTSGALGVLVTSGTGEDQYWGSFTTPANIINSTSTLTSSWQRFSYTGTTASSISQLYVLFGMYPTGTASTNDYFEITGVQLEKGSVATPLESRFSQTELALCQRYFQSCTWNGMAGADDDYSVNCFGGTFPVQMRISPNITVGGTTAIGHHTTQPSVEQTNSQSVSFTWSGGAYRSIGFRVIQSFTASAEL